MIIVRNQMIYILIEFIKYILYDYYNQLDNNLEDYFPDREDNNFDDSDYHYNSD